MSIDGKHGNYGFHIKETTCNDGDHIEFDNPIFVMVHDNTKNGMAYEDMRKVADASIKQHIYWNDLESYYWMYDFKVYDYWCEMLHEKVTGESIYDCMHISVTE